MVLAVAREVDRHALPVADLAAEQLRREAVADHQRRFYGIGLDPEREVLVTAGATEALAATILALIDSPEDEVVVFEPYYDSYAATVAMAGAKRRTVPLAPDTSPVAPLAPSGFRLDRDALADHLTGVDVPAYEVSADVMSRIVGFHLNRGVLAAAYRPPSLSVDDVLGPAPSR